MAKTDIHEIEVDHDPFAIEQQVLPPELANLPPGKALELLMKFDERMFNMELQIAQAVFEIRNSLGAMGAHVKGLSDSHERLRQAIKKPKKIVRDADGRPTRVEVDGEV